RQAFRSTMVAWAAARPPWSAPGCQSGPESNRSPLRGFVPASFMGPRSKAQGRSGGELDSNEHLFASQEGSPASLYVTPAKPTGYVTPAKPTGRYQGSCSDSPDGPAIG